MLISITDLISKAHQENLYLGQGDPREHLSYLSKIGVLPKTTRKKNSLGRIEGHYPQESVDKLRQISLLRSQGMTFSQIGKWSNAHALSFNQPVLAYSPSRGEFSSGPLSFLLIGLVMGFLLAKATTAPLEKASLTKAVAQQPAGLPVDDSLAKPLTASFLTKQDKSNETIYVLTVSKNHLFSIGEKQKLNLTGEAIEN